MRLKNRLGELISAYKRKHGERLTQLELAKHTGIAQSTISAYVNNDVLRYDSKTVTRLLAFFAVGVEEFFVVEGCVDAEEIEVDGHKDGGGKKAPAPTGSE